MSDLRLVCIPWQSYNAQVSEVNLSAFGFQADIALLLR